VPDRSTLTLGLDLGTSAVKAVVLDPEGRTLATGTSPFATASREPGQAEQAVADWTAAVERACTELDRALAPQAPGWRERAAAVGVAGQLPTLVCGRGDAPLGAAITWQDARADRWAAAAIGADERRRLYARTGMPIDGRYLGPMFHQHWRDRADEVEFVLSAKDYLVFALTGERVTDPSTAAGYAVFDIVDGAFSAELCERWQLPARTLPVVRPAHARAGGLTAAGARLVGLAAGLPVTVGAADSVAGAYALTGLQEGVVSIAMGSSTIILDAIRERRLDPAVRYLLTPHVTAGWYGREMDLLATGTGYAWLAGLFNWQPAELDARAASSPPGAGGLTFTPYLAGGEQGALWDPRLTGSIRGLGLQHSPADIARALLEGINFEIRRCTDVLAATCAIHRIVVSGQIVDRPASLQMLADLLQWPVESSRLSSPAAVGAALGARELAGLPPWSAAPEPRAARVWPGANRATYQDLYANYLAVTP